MLSYLLLVCAVGARLVVTGVSGACPHLDAGLQRWSDVSTWEGGVKPGPNSKVVISGRRILLDESPPELNGIDIRDDGALVWDDKEGITLVTKHVLVSGSFIIGSEDCKFTKKAHIILTGKSNDPGEVGGFGRKFVGVAEGGVLEIHGEEKLSWTKLAATIPAASQTCGVLYDHKTTPYIREWGKGLHVMVWNIDGSLHDFNIFLLGEEWDTWSDELFEKYVNAIPRDKVVAMAVKRGLGIGSPGRDFQKVYRAVETLGGITSGSGKIRDVADVEAYAFITYVGKPELTREQHSQKVAHQNYTKTDDVKIDLWEQKLKFSVESAVKWQGPWGTPDDVNFKVMTTDVAYPKIDVIDDRSSWKPGDRVVFASTDFSWKQAEEKTLYSCDDCNSHQFRVDGGFEFSHYGEITENVDERGEVALLSRNILIEGRMEKSCYGDSEREKELCALFNMDTFGGHLKVHRNFSSVHIQGAEFYHMGQQHKLGHYPIHFHMCDDVDGAWVRHNSIHQTLGRCVTIHGTDGLEVSNNVCFDHLGHGYFLEDSVEQRNVLDGNIGLSTKYGALTLSDRKRAWCNQTLQNHCDGVSTFWITHPNNYIRNNVAAGSEVVGFWFINSDRPLGPSSDRQKERGLVKENSTRYTRVKQFDNNVAHSNVKAGLFMDSKISYGQMYHGKFVPETGIIGGNMLDAREPPEIDGERVYSTLNRFTGYKNRDQNAWIRAGNFLFENSTFADSIRGLTMAISAGNTAQEVRNSLFVGETANLGMAETWRNWTHPGQQKPTHHFSRSIPSWDPNYALQGFIFYDGPNYVTNCHFSNFRHLFWNQTYEAEWGIRAFRPAGGIGFLRKNAFQSKSLSQIEGASFSYCDKEAGNWVFDGNRSMIDFDEMDGDLQATFHDVDGSVTGHAGTQVVKNIPFMTSPRCSFRETWQMSVCPYRYAKMTFHGDGALADKKGNYPIKITRDDVTDFPFSLKGNHGLTFLTMINKTYTVNFNGNAPKSVTIYADDLRSGDFIRLGICFPKDSTKFEFSSWYPHISSQWNPPVQVNSIEELDEDQSGRAYYWDSNIGLLFIKLMSNETRASDDRRGCPNGKCPNMKISRLDGGTVNDCLTSSYGPYKAPADVAITKPDPNDCSTSSAEGFGAGLQRSSSYKPPVGESPFCPSLQVTDVGDIQTKHRGCYKDDWSYRDFSLELLRLYTSMTREICIGRCYRHGYRYAAIMNGNECRCGDRFGVHGADPGSCNKPCSGDKATSCGGAMRNEVFATGTASPPEPPRCGPGSRGIISGQKCFFLISENRDYLSAQRECVKLGGNLASITSLEEQEVVTGYIRQGSGDVWFGLNDVTTEGKFEFIDGSQTTGFSHFKSGAPSGWWNEEDYGILDEKAMYQWDDRGRDEKKRSLCQLPVSPVSMTMKSCGFNNQGVELGGSGSCYATINAAVNRDDAEYSCLTRFGVLAPFNSSQEQKEIRQHLFYFGSAMDYWVGEKLTDSYVELASAKLYGIGQEGKWATNGVVCLLGNYTPCPPGWVLFKDYCYLYTGRTAGSYTQATSLCNGGSSNLLSIETKEENDFIFDFVKSREDGTAQRLYLGYKYTDQFDKYVWSDGTTSPYSNWASGNGAGNVETGSCAGMRSWDVEHAWENTPCDKNWLKIVCKSKKNKLL